MDWRKANPDVSARDYKFQYKKMSVSGALFDIVKLNDVSKNYGFAPLGRKGV